MSVYLVNRYIAELEKVIRFGGSRNEGALEMEFRNLLNEYCKQKGFVLVPKIAIKTPDGKNIIPDGVIKDSLRLDWGYWESKDEKDDLDEEIEAKFRKGYPKDNILFEDKLTAVLWQGGKEFGRCDMTDAKALDELLTKFTSYERPEVKNFRKAIELFKQDLPIVVETLRDMIEVQAATNKNFRDSREAFWELCKQVINPDISPEDIREMVIQHILTEDIFNTIFDETQFHRENNIAQELQKVCDTFFVGETRRNTLGSIQHYYQVINANAAGIVDHHEKQKFLKVIYETFYKGYNPKAADRLGIVYTPGEIVNFMIESTDYLLHKHFGKSLGDKNVEILDPATGTGTFICDIIDYLPANQLAYKYKNEIHANEVAILPYYIANLNIEYTYKQKMGSYAEFENICFVDTLDNMGFDYKNKQQGMFGIAAENAERIKRQNEKKISVIIGNPPYNANQANENDNNKNREYDEIDKRIKATYIKESTAQKTKVYDMYARFFRWACDRVNENGVLAFITNRSFIDSRTYDGFRKIMAEDFAECYIVDLGGDVRLNPKLSGTKNNVFGIQTGVAISFWVRKANKEGLANIYYARRPEMDTIEDKLSFLSASKLSTMEFESIRPDAKNNWINLADNDFESLMPLADKKTKLAKTKDGERAIFRLYTLGSVTNRDEWVYDNSKDVLSAKVNSFIINYNKEVKRLYGQVNNQTASDKIKSTIKFTRDLKKDLVRGVVYKFKREEFRECLYRVFVKKNLYFASELNEMQYQMPVVFPKRYSENKLIAINQGSKDFNAVASKYIVDLHFNGDSQCLPLYRYDMQGNRIDNITDWGLEQFREHYCKYKDLSPKFTEGKAPKVAARSKNAKDAIDAKDSTLIPNPSPLKGEGDMITKEDIFHYVYGVLHNPAYRKKYELNLKREFPRIPFYEDFWQWAKWGKELMELHIGYETVKPFTLTKSHPPTPSTPMEGEKKLKAKLKADKELGHIILDEETTLMGIPKEAWEYKLGNRSALEWILDQYKEKTPKDPTIREKFNTYKFADYKDKVIDLISRVTTVSVRTVEIMGEMEGEK